MGKKRAVILGSPEEDQLKAKKAVKLEQKKLRTGTSVAKSAEPVSHPERPVVSPAVAPLDQPAAAVSSPKVARTRSSTYLAARSQVDSARLYPLSDAIELLRKVSYSKNNDTVELHLQLRAKPSSDLKVSLPHAQGQTKKVVIVSDSLLKQLESGKIDFDLLVAAPGDMPKLVKYAKVLGPRGLMPNPKTGTISDDPTASAKKLATDTSRTLKLDKSGPVVHTTVGKLSQSDSHLSANISAVLSAASPTGLTKAVLKSTMSPAIRLVI